jgi:hypothetical protein
MPENAFTRRGFLAQSAAAATAAAVGVSADQVAMAADEDASSANSKQTPKDPAVKIGFHTDAFNSAHSQERETA